MDEFSKYEVKPIKQEDEFSQYAVEPTDEFAQYAAQSEEPQDEFAQYAAEPVEAKPESPTWISEPVTPEEIAAIAMKHGITDVEDIKALSTQIYLKGGTVEGQTRPFAYAAGLASDLVLPGDIPAFLQKKLQEKPELRAAMDDVASLSEDKQSTARTVGTLAGGLLIPGLGVTKALGAAERIGGKVLGGAAFGAGMGAVAGVAESKEGQEGQSAAVGAALGGALGGGLGAVGGWITRKEMANADRIKNVILEGTPDSDKLMPQIERKFAETFVPGSDRERKVLADDETLKKMFGKKEVPKAIIEERKEFIKYINATESLIPDANVSKTIAAIRHNLGETATQEAYAGFKKTKIAEEFKDEVLTQGLDKAPVSIVQSITKLIEPAMYMANRVDKLVQTNFNKGINELSEATNLWKNKAYGLNLKLQPIAQAALADAKKLDMTSTAYLDELFHTLDGTSKSDLFKDKPEVIKAWRDLLEDVRVEYNLPHGEEVIRAWTDAEGNVTFAPHRVVDVPTAIDRIQRRIYVLEDTLPQFKEAMGKVTAGKKAGLEDLLSTLKEEDANSVREVVHAIEHVSGKKLSTVNKLSRTFEDVSRNPAKSMHVTEVSGKSAKSRTGRTPKLLLETNMIKLTEDLILNSMKAAYIAKPISKMKAELMAAGAAGVDKTYLDPIGDLLQDVAVGSRAGTWAQKTRDSLMTVRIQARKAALQAEREDKPLKSYMFNSLSKIPGVMSYMGDQVYPNTLGALTNPTSPLRNLMQPFMMTSAEVGYRYSVPTVVRGMAWALRHPKQAAAELAELGLHGEGWDKIYNSVLSDPEIGKVARAAMKVNSEAMEWNMKLFSNSEIINRYTAYTLGKKAAADMVASVSNPGKLTFEQSTALNFIETMPDANKRSVMQLLEQLPSSDAPEAVIKQLEKEVAQHLIQKTIFDYNKANASIMARYLPAPMLVFTKFPTYLAGDIMNKIEEKGLLAASAGPLMRNYLAPFAIANQIDELNDEMLGDDNTVMDWAFGESGLKGVTNLGALGGFRVLGNPVAAAPVNVVGNIGAAAVGVMQGDLEAAGKSVEGAAKGVSNTAALYSPTAISSPLRAFWNFAKWLDE